MDTPFKFRLPESTALPSDRLFNRGLNETGNGPEFPDTGRTAITDGLKPKVHQIRRKFGLRQIVRYHF